MCIRDRAIVTETSLTETISNNVVRTIGGTLNDTVTGVGTITMTASGSEVNASGILLTGHTHTDPAGVAGGANDIYLPENQKIAGGANTNIYLNDNETV